VQERVLLSYLHHFADTDKDGSLCPEELSTALAPFVPTARQAEAQQQQLMQVGSSQGCVLYMG